jgi:hypothetical protein
MRRPPNLPQGEVEWRLPYHTLARAMVQQSGVGRGVPIRQPFMACSEGRRLPHTEQVATRCISLPVTSLTTLEAYNLNQLQQPLEHY